MGCSWMVIVGGVLEGFGFLVIVLKLILVQYREFGWPRSALRLRATWRRLLRKPPIKHRVGVSLASSFDIAARLQIRKGMGPDVADRLGAIEHNLRALDEDFSQRNKEQDENVAKLRQDLNTLRSEFTQAEKERDREQKAELQASMRWEASGTGLFVLGLILSVVGSVTTC